LRRLAGQGFFAPQHILSERALGCIVRQPDVRMLQERPAHRLIAQQVSALVGRAGSFQLTAFFQRLYERSPESIDPSFQSISLMGVTSVSVTHAEQGVGDQQQPFSDHTALSCALTDLDKMADQMRPTQLSATRIDPVVSAVVIGDDEPQKVTQ